MKKRSRVKRGVEMGTGIKVEHSDPRLDGNFLQHDCINVNILVRSL